MAGVARAAPANIARRITDHARLLLLIRFITGVLLGVGVRSLADLDGTELPEAVTLSAGANDACCLLGETRRVAALSEERQQHVNDYISRHSLSMERLERWLGRQQT